MTNTQVDKLGERIKAGITSEEDLRILDSYRRSFGFAYEEVIGSIRDKLILDPTGRPTKSTTSISEKLRREHIRLSQMQDIAGCRLIVESIIEQDHVVESLKKLFDHVRVIDRREVPSHDYRAVHVIVTISDKAVEIQVRTLLQQKWAEFSEKVADVIDPAIKYGGGNKTIRSALKSTSDLIASLEAVERKAVILGREEEFAQPIINLKTALSDNLKAFLIAIKKIIETKGGLD